MDKSSQPIYWSCEQLSAYVLLLIVSFVTQPVSRQGGELIGGRILQPLYPALCC